MEPLPTTCIGQEFGPYTITGHPLKGQRFLVYPALGPEGEVAIKTLYPNGGGAADAPLRFNREIAALHRLNHPGILKIYRFGRQGDRPWLSLPFLKGPFLEQIIKTAPDLRRQVELLRQLARAMAHAHEQGVIHQELTPAKIRLEHQGPTAKLIILGFGGAHFLESRISRRQTKYMRIIQGEEDTVDRQVDLWSLGVMLYQLLTGRLPLVGALDLKTRPWRRLTTLEVEPPEKLNRRVDPYLAGICRKALAGEYDHAREMQTELEDWEEANRRRLFEASRQQRENGHLKRAAYLMRQALDYVPWHQETLTQLEKIWELRLRRSVRIQLLSRLPEEVTPARELREHPNIVPLLAVQRGPYPYLVLGRPSGPTLRQRMRQGPLSPEEILEIGRGVAAALSAAQAAGVPLRALGPERIHLGDQVQVAGLGWLAGKPLDPVSALAKLLRQLTISSGGIPPGFQIPLAQGTSVPSPYADVNVFMDELEKSYQRSLPPEQQGPQVPSAFVAEVSPPPPDLADFARLRQAVLAVFLKTPDLSAAALQQTVQRHDKDFVVEVVALDTGGGSLAITKLTAPFAKDNNQLNLAWEYGYRQPCGPGTLEPVFKNLLLLKMLDQILAQGLQAAVTPHTMAGHLYTLLVKQLPQAPLQDAAFLQPLRNLIKAIWSYDPLAQSKHLGDLSTYQQLFKEHATAEPLLALLEQYLARIRRHHDPLVGHFEELWHQISTVEDGLRLQKLQVMFDTLITFHPLTPAEEPLRTPALFAKIQPVRQAQQEYLRTCLQELTAPQVLRHYYLDQRATWLADHHPFLCADGQIIWTIPIPASFVDHQGREISLAQEQGRQWMQQLTLLLEALQYLVDFCGPINRFGDLLAEWLKLLWLARLESICQQTADQTQETQAQEQAWWAADACLEIDLPQALLDSIAPTLEPTVRLWNKITAGRIPAGKVLDAWASLSGRPEFCFRKRTAQDYSIIRTLGAQLQQTSSLPFWHICRLLHPVVAVGVSRALSPWRQARDKLYLPPAVSSRLAQLAAYASVRLYELHAAVYLRPEELPVLRMRLLADLLRMWHVFCEEHQQQGPTGDYDWAEALAAFENIRQAYRQKEPNIDDIELIALISRCNPTNPPTAQELLEAIRSIKPGAQLSTPPHAAEIEAALQDWASIYEEWNLCQDWVISQVEHWGEKLVIQTETILQEALQPLLQELSGASRQRALLSIQHMLSAFLGEFSESLGVQLDLPARLNPQVERLYRALLQAAYGCFSFPPPSYIAQSLTAAQLTPAQVEQMLAAIDKRNLGLSEEQLGSPAGQEQYLAKLALLRQAAGTFIEQFEQAAMPFAQELDLTRSAEQPLVWRAYLLTGEEALALFQRTTQLFIKAWGLDQSPYKKRIQSLILTAPQQVAQLRSQGGVFNPAALWGALVALGEQYLGQPPHGRGIGKFFQRTVATADLGCTVYYRGDIHQQVEVNTYSYTFAPPFVYASIYYHPHHYQLQVIRQPQAVEPPAPWFPVVRNALLAVDEATLELDAAQLASDQACHRNITPRIQTGRSVANFWLAPQLENPALAPEVYHLVQIEITNPVALFQALEQTQPQREHRLAYLFIPLSFPRQPHNQQLLLVFFRHEIHGEHGLEGLRFYPVVDPLPFAPRQRFIEYTHSTPGFFSHKHQIGFDYLLRHYYQKLQARGEYVAAFSQASIFPTIQGHLPDVLRSDTIAARFLKLAFCTDFSPWERFVSPSLENALRKAGRLKVGRTTKIRIGVGEGQRRVKSADAIAVHCACGRQAFFSAAEQGQTHRCQACGTTWEIPPPSREVQRVGPPPPPYQPRLHPNFKWQGNIVVCEKDQAPMVMVPCGAFIRGREEGQHDERPARKIYLDTFLIDILPVTNARYGQFIEDGGYQQRTFWTAAGWEWKENHDIQTPLFWFHSSWNQPEQPVVGVSWYEAKAYCEWAGKHLPSEAQWEKAARGGLWLDGYQRRRCKNPCQQRQWPWGNQPPTARHANYRVSGPRLSTPVGRYPQGASPYGCLDMAGNVREWCEDNYDEHFYHTSPRKNPLCVRSETIWVQRGGSFYDDAEQLETGRRAWGVATRYDYVGFRTARRI